MDGQTYWQDRIARIRRERAAAIAADRAAAHYAYATARAVRVAERDAAALERAERAWTDGRRTLPFGS